MKIKIVKKASNVEAAADSAASWVDEPPMNKK